MRWIGLLVQTVIHNFLHIASHLELYLAKYILRKCQIKMQRNFYTPKSPNYDAAKIQCFTVSVSSQFTCTVKKFCRLHGHLWPIISFQIKISTFYISRAKLQKQALLQFQSEILPVTDLCKNGWEISQKSVQEEHIEMTHVGWHSLFSFIHKAVIYGNITNELINWRDKLTTKAKTYLHNFA